MNLTELKLTHLSFVVKFISTNRIYRGSELKSGSCSISNLVQDTLRLDLLYWGLKISCYFSTIQMQEILMNHFPFYLLLILPSPPILAATPVGQNMIGKDFLAQMKEFIFLKPYSFMHQQSTVCWQSPAC